MINKSIRICLISLLFLGGCSDKTKVESDLHIKGAPEWVNHGTQMLNDQKGRLFHGVGSAPMLADQSLQKSIADDRARAELARILTSYLQVATTDFSETAISGQQQSNAQSLSREIRNVSNINLTGSVIIGRWRDKKNGTIYAIAELDLARLPEVLPKIDAMDQGFGDYLQNQGGSLFDRLTGDDS